MSFPLYYLTNECASRTNLDPIKTVDPLLSCCLYPPYSILRTVSNRVIVAQLRKLPLQWDTWGEQLYLVAVSITMGLLAALTRFGGIAFSGLDTSTSADAADSIMLPAMAANSRPGLMAAHIFTACWRR